MNCFGVKTPGVLVLGAVVVSLPLFSLLSSVRKETTTLSGATIQLFTEALCRG